MSSIGNLVLDIPKNQMNKFAVSRNIIKNQIFSRTTSLALLPCSLVTGIADTVLGTAATAASILTLGKFEGISKFAARHIASGIITNPYVFLLKTINPNAQFTTHNNALISAEGRGFIAKEAYDFFAIMEYKCQRSESLIMNYLGSRITSAVMAIACVVTRAVDGVIGIIAAAFSLLTLGKVESFNNLAFRGLQITDVINDLLYCTLKVFNPELGYSLT